MPLITPEFLQSVFAASGDTVQLPQTDPAGFVNYKDGYTSAYEISLNANNPQAKAVERPIQNYLFKMLSTNAMAWQRMGFPAWISAAQGNSIGYDKNAFVLRTIASGESAVFRSLVDANLSDPINTPAAWELQPTVADTLSRIPMPLGGSFGPSGSIIGAAADFNAYTTRTFLRVGNDNIAAACTNLPIFPGSIAVAGVLEVSDWTFNANSFIFQRYSDRFGNVATRTCLNGAWPAWSFSPTLNQVQANRSNFLTISSIDGLTYTGNLNPIPTLVDGFEIRAFTAGSPVKAGAVLNLNGLGPLPIFGTSGGPVVDLEFRVRSSLTLRYSATIGCWVMVSVSSGMPTGRAVNDSSQLVTSGQVQSGNMNFTRDTLSATTPNAYGGTFVPDIQGPTPGMVVRILAGTANTSANPTFRVSPGAADLPIANIAGGALLPGQIQPGAILELTYLQGANAWLLTQATGSQAASSVPVGGVILVTTPTVPPGYLELDQSLQKRALLPQLYAAIGNYYNLAGDPSDSFRLPPSRGYFVRGADRGAGVDPGRALGTTQAPANMSHTHTGTTANAGTHTHAGSQADAGGTHNHIATATPVGDHTHQVGTLMGYNNGGGNGINSGVVASNTTPNTSPGGAHNHDINVQGGGLHGHTLSIANAGDHNHAFTTDASGANESRPVNIAFMYCIKAFDVPVNQGTIDVAVLSQQVQAMRRMVPGSQKFLTPGTFTFVVPNDARPDSVFEVKCWGGGASGSFEGANGGGSGGGSGAYGTSRLVGLSPGTAITVQVAAGGARIPAGTTSLIGLAGGTSSFGPYISASGGVPGGKIADGTWVPGLGGQSVQGASVSYATTGSPGFGVNVNSRISGNGGSAPSGGSGGAGAVTGQTDASNGYVPGGGGGGSGLGSGGGSGAGGPGAVFIDWF